MYRHNCRPMRCQPGALALSVALLLAVPAAGVPHALAQVRSKAEAAPAASVPATAEAVLQATTARASCLIEANSVIKLSSATQGVLSRVDINRGDVVQAGQMVAQLESDVEIAQLAAAKLRSDTDAIVKSRRAEAEFNKTRAGRSRELMQKQIVAPQKHEENETQAAMARFALDQAIFEQKVAAIEVERLTAIIERRRIRAPVSGVVTRIDLHPGEYADPAQSIATMAENRPLRVEIYLPAEAYPHIKVGMRIEVRPREPIGGSYVTEILVRDPVIDSASGLFQIQARLANADGAIPAGIRCTISFPK